MKHLINAALARIGLHLTYAETIPDLRSHRSDLERHQSHLESQLVEARGASYLVPSVYGHRVQFDPLDAGMNLSSLAGLEPSGEAAFIVRTLRPGQTAIDVGANIGVLTLLMARTVGNSGKVYAFEPGPRSYRLLQANIAANNYQNVVAENLAVGAGSADTELLVCASGESDNRLNGIAVNEKEYFRIPMKVVALDEYLADNQVDFIKIDAQGSEYEILLGLRETILANPKMQMVAEYGPGWLTVAGVNPDDYFGLIESLGLQMFDLPEEGAEFPVDREWLATNIDGFARPQTNLILRHRSNV